MNFEIKFKIKKILKKTTWPLELEAVGVRVESTPFPAAGIQNSTSTSTL